MLHGAPRRQGLCGRIQTPGRTPRPVQIPRQENVISAECVCSDALRGQVQTGDWGAPVGRWKVLRLDVDSWPPHTMATTHRSVHVHLCAQCLPIRSQRTVRAEQTRAPAGRLARFRGLLQRCPSLHETPGSMRPISQRRKLRREEEEKVAAGRRARPHLGRGGQESLASGTFRLPP